jgi:hypothetical protein
MNDYVNKWKAALMQPKETFAAEKKNASIVAGMKHIAIGYFLTGLVMAIIVMLLPGAGVFAGAGIVFPIWFAISGVIGSVIGAGIPFLFAKLLGGNGTMSQQYYLISLYLAPFALLTILQVIPVVGALFGLALFVYGLYLLTIIIKEVHGLSTAKAVAAWLIPVIIVVVLMLLLFGALLFTLLGGGLALSQAAGPGLAK